MRKSIFWICRPFAVLAMAFLFGCDRADKDGEPSSAVINLESLPDQPPVREIQIAKSKFEPANRVGTASGGFVYVESPGYASPTLVDVNLDGQLDLAVGQFAGGKTKIYFGIEKTDTGARFGKSAWILSGGKPAEVTGIS